MPNEEIFHLNLETAIENLNRNDEWSLESLYIVPGDDNYFFLGDIEGGPSRGVYRVGAGMVEVELMDHLQQRIYLPLPNPRNWGTVDVVMTVPYEPGSDPVRLAMALPAEDGPSNRHSHRVLQFDVTQEPDSSDVGAASGARHLPLDSVAVIEHLRAMRIVKLLPRLGLVDMPEPQNHPCWICKEPYGIGSHPVSEQRDDREMPACLSCNHVLGERCLSSWLHTYQETQTSLTHSALCAGKSSP